MIGATSILPAVNGEAKITSKQIGSSNQATDFSAVVSLLLGEAQKSNTQAAELLSTSLGLGSEGNATGVLSENSGVNSVIVQLIAAVTKEQTIDLSQLKVAGVKISPENLTPKGVVNLIQSLQLLLKQGQIATKQNSSTAAELSQWESLLSDLQAGKSILAKISLPEGEVSLLFLSNSVANENKDVEEQQLHSDEPAFTLLLMPPVANTVEQQDLIKRTGFSKISLAEFDFKSAVPVQLNKESEGAKTGAVDPLVKSLIALAKQEDLTPIQIEKLISKLKTQLSRVINNTAKDVDSTVSVSPEVINNIIARVIQAFNDEQSLQTDPKFKEIIAKLFSGTDDNKAIQQLKLELANKSSDDPSLAMVINTGKSEVNIVQISDFKGELTEQKIVTPFASAYNNDSELKQALSAIKEIFENSDKNVFKSVVDATALKPAKTKIEIDTNSDGVKTVVLNFKSSESAKSSSDSTVGVATTPSTQTTEQAIKGAYAETEPTESAPVAAKQTTEPKPTEVKPAEAKQTEVKQSEVKNVEANPTTEIKSGDALAKEELKPQATPKPPVAETKQSEVVIKESSPEVVKTAEQAIKGAYAETEPTESAPVAAKQTTEPKPTEVKPAEVKQTEVKQSEVKNVQANPTPEIQSGDALAKEELKPQATPKPPVAETKQSEVVIKESSPEVVKTAEQAIKGAYTETEPTESAPVAAKQTTEPKPTEVKPAEVKQTEVKQSEVKNVQANPTPEIKSGDALAKEELKPQATPKPPVAETKQSVSEQTMVEKNTTNYAKNNVEELSRPKDVSETKSLPSEELKIVAAVYEKSGKRQLKIAVNDEAISQKIENFIKEQPIIKNFEVRVVRPESQVAVKENTGALKSAANTSNTKGSNDTVEKSSGLVPSEQSSQSNTSSGFANKDQSFSTFTQTAKADVLPRELVELRDLEITKSSRAHEIIAEVTKFLQKKDANRLTLLLEPETLGKVKVILSVLDDSMKARIEVENNTVKKILESNVNQLLSSNNSNQSVQLTSVQITVAHGENKQQRQQHHQQPKKKTGGKEFNVESKSDANEPSKSMGYNTYDYIA